MKDNNLNYKIWREEVDQIMKTGTPEQVERDQNWLAGIGLQGVDNLRVSNYLLELSLQNIKDEIDFDELKNDSIDSMIKKEADSVLKQHEKKEKSVDGNYQ